MKRAIALPPAVRALAFVFIRLSWGLRPRLYAARPLRGLRASDPVDNFLFVALSLALYLKEC